MEIASVTYHISTLLHLSPTVEWWFIPQDLSSTPATRSSGTMACFPRRQTACSSCTTWRYYELTNSVRPADKRWSWRNAQRHSTEKDAAGNAPVDTLHHQELEAFSRAATWPTANSSRSCPPLLRGNPWKLPPDRGTSERIQCGVSSTKSTSRLQRRYQPQRRSVVSEPSLK